MTMSAPLSFSKERLQDLKRSLDDFESHLGDWQWTTSTLGPQLASVASALRSLIDALAFEPGLVWPSTTLRDAVIDLAPLQAICEISSKKLYEFASTAKDEGDFNSVVLCHRLVTESVLKAQDRLDILTITFES